MRNIWVIFKKELKRFFTDKRMLMSLILPGILIFVIYSLMGNFMTDSFSVDKDYTYIVYVENNVESFAPIYDSKDYKIELHEDYQETEVTIKEKIVNGEIDLYIVFEEDFENKLSTVTKPNISLFYNSTSSESSEIYTYFYAMFSSGGTHITFDYYVNSDINISYDLATEEDVSKMMLTMIMPFLLMVFLFSGSMAVSTESIAGEKERGTMAKLLVSPIKRSEIALGKILALSLTSMFSSVFSFVGLIGSLPKLMQEAGDITLSMYGIDTYISIFVIMIITVILFTTILSLLSTFAKSVKEASQYALPVMIITMIAGMGSLLNMGEIVSSWYFYLIPIYNSVQCMSSLFSLEFNLINFIVTIISNMVYISIGVFALTKMFNSERIMFNK